MNELCEKLIILINREYQLRQPNLLYRCSTDEQELLGIMHKHKEFANDLLFHHDDHIISSIDLIKVRGRFKFIFIIFQFPDSPNWSVQLTNRSKSC